MEFLIAHELLTPTGQSLVRQPSLVYTHDLSDPPNITWRQMYENKQLVEQIYGQSISIVYQKDVRTFRYYSSLINFDLFKTHYTNHAINSRIHVWDLIYSCLRHCLKSDSKHEVCKQLVNSGAHIPTLLKIASTNPLQPGRIYEL